MHETFLPFPTATLKRQSRRASLGRSPKAAEWPQPEWVESFRSLGSSVVFTGAGFLKLNFKVSGL